MKRKAAHLTVIGGLVLLLSSCDVEMYPYYLKQNLVNVSLVIDTSGSMIGDKISNARVAAESIVDILTENDYISVVSFNTAATVVVEPTAVTDKAAIKAKIATLAAGGGTDASSGLTEGYALLGRNLSDGRTSSCLLICDGSISANAPSLASGARGNGVTTSGIAVGDGVQTAALQGVVDAGGGSLYAVQNSTDLSGAFAEAIKQILYPVGF